MNHSPDQGALTQNADMPALPHLIIQPVGKRRAVVDHAQRLKALEDLFMLELMVASDSFGFSAQERRAWALQSVLTAEHVEHYVSAWKRAGGAAWKRLNSRADELRRICGDDRSQWETRLMRLEDCVSQDCLRLAESQRSGERQLHQSNAAP